MNEYVLNLFLFNGVDPCVYTYHITNLALTIMILVRAKFQRKEKDNRAMIEMYDLGPQNQRKNNS